MPKVMVIAEAGVNHNGRLDNALSMIDSAASCGVDVVKFQTFRAAKLVTASAQKANYQDKNTKLGESQLEMLKNLELTDEQHLRLIHQCNARGVVFSSTAFDEDSQRLLDSFELPFSKVPSGEVTNLPFLRKVGAAKGRVLLSTGMCTLGEVETAIRVLEESGTQRSRITVLHCNTQYPTPIWDVNLNAMVSMKHAFGVEVGYSDHTIGIEVCIAAVALGATVIEKHFTLDRNLPGPDHAASLEPCELKEMVRAIRNIEQALGDGIKKPTRSELENQEVARKSIVAAVSIAKGERFTEANLTVKRPGSGVSPMLWDKVIDRHATRDYLPDELIEW